MSYKNRATGNNPVLEYFIKEFPPVQSKPQAIVSVKAPATAAQSLASCFSAVPTICYEYLPLRLFVVQDDGVVKQEGELKSHVDIDVVLVKPEVDIARVRTGDVNDSELEIFVNGMILEFHSAAAAKAYFDRAAVSPTIVEKVTKVQERILKAAKVDKPTATFVILKGQYVIVLENVIDVEQAAALKIAQHFAM